MVWPFFSSSPKTDNQLQGTETVPSASELIDNIEDEGWVIIDRTEMPPSPAVTLTESNDVPSIPRSAETSMGFQSVLWDDAKDFVNGFYELAPARLVEKDPSESVRPNAMMQSTSFQREKLAASMLSHSLARSQMMSKSVRFAEGEPEAAADVSDDTSSQQEQPEWVADLLLTFAQSAQEQLVEGFKDVRVVAPVLSPLEANETFNSWRRGLWFAPTDFSQLISDPIVRLAFVPYYCVQPVTVSHFRGNLSVRGENEWQQVSSSQETVHDTIIAYGSAPMPEDLRKLLSKVEGWDMEASLPAQDILSRAGNTQQQQQTSNNIDVEVQGLASAEEIWEEVEDVILDAERAASRERLLEEYKRRRGHEIADHDDIQIRDVTLTKVVYKEARYRVVYVPLYLVKYHNEDVYQTTPSSTPASSSQDKEFAFLLNGQTGERTGQRPYGMGKVLGGGMRVLEGLFGIKDQDRPALVTGHQLRLIDGVPYYRKKAHYLIFPPSHSYIFYTDVGYVTLRNTSTYNSNVHIRLVAQRRFTDHIENDISYDLAPGQEETFDYRGNWCLRITYVVKQQPQQHQQRKEKEVIEKIYDDDDEESQVLGDYLLVTEVHGSGGGHYGDLLGMA